MSDRASSAVCTGGLTSPVRLIRSFPIAGIESLWQRTRGDPRTVVALLDGPVDLDHPCFAQADVRVVRSAVAERCKGAHSAACQHGTGVASIIAAQHANAGSIRGLAPRCRLVVVPIFEDSSRPGVIAPCSQSMLAAAIHRAIDSGARIINVSAGQPAREPVANPVLAAAVDRCIRENILLIAAAGNDGCDCLHVPAAIPAVLTVGSLDTNGRPADFSNFGRAYRAKGVLAPGINVPAAAVGGGVELRTGTSFSAAIVSGVAALLMSLQPEGCDVRHLRDAILRGADPCQSDRPGACDRHLVGRLNVERSTAIFLKGVHPMSTGSGEEKVVFSGQSEVDDTLGVRASCACQNGTAGAKPSCGCPGAGTGNQSNPADEDDEDGNSNPANVAPNVAASRLGARPASVASRLAPSARAVRPQTVLAAAASERRIRPSQADAASAPGQLVYALGSLWYDFGTQARYDSIDYEMPDNEHPSNPKQLLNYLKKNPYDCEAVTWLLQLDVTPIYALRPTGPYAAQTYSRIIEFLEEQLADKVERVSVPGRLAGSVMLMSGQQVPVVEPELRGMYNWTTTALVEASLKATKVAGEKGGDARRREAVRSFLERVYFELRNMGLSAEERAINFAATNAFNVERAFERAAQEQFELDDIEVDRSPICRQDSDCWDIKLIFFNPANTLGEARTVSRFTVDVSDVVPVLVGPMREWKMR